MKPGAAVRASAARIIAAVLGGESLDRVASPVLEEVAERDRSLCREIAYGTLRHYPQLQGLLEQLLDRPLRKRDQELGALALAGLYQLSAMRIPPHAAVSATVEASSLLGKGRSRGFLNAVLRRYQREAAVLEEQLDDAQRHAHPPWLWQALEKHWPAQRDAIARANNERPPMTLRVNARSQSRDAYVRTLEDASIAIDPGAASPDALYLRQAVDVGALPGFGDGAASVQDESAQLAARLLAPKAGEAILDACAAPGGKSCHLLEVESDLVLTAMDKAPERLARVEENLQRLGLSAGLVCADGASPSQELCSLAPFDAMLVDVPCSATGVIRRHPDIKVLRREGDIAGFARQQDAILDGLWPLLRPGGRLLYVTCSVLPMENSERVAAFLARHGDCLEDTPPVPGAESQPHGWQVLPDVDGGDGLFFALLHKS